MTCIIRLFGFQNGRRRDSKLACGDSGTGVLGRKLGLASGPGLAGLRRSATRGIKKLGGKLHHTGQPSARESGLQALAVGFCVG